MSLPPSGAPSPSAHSSGWQRKCGLGLAILILPLFVWPPAFGGLPEDAMRVALLTLLMGTLWITEAVPIPATALLPLVLLPMLGVSPIRQAAAPYADPIIYLFMGGFMLALAMERWNLHQRIALAIIGLIGSGPRSLVLGFLCSAAFISMWTSNSATAMMLLPISLGVFKLLESSPSAKAGATETGAALVLAIAYGANIGGMGTLIGTPPNAILKAYLQKAHGVEIGFAQWMLLGVPVILVSLPLVYFILTRLSFKVGAEEVPGIREKLAEERRSLGRMRRPEWVVVGAFGLAISLWVTRELWKVEGASGSGKFWSLRALLTDEVVAMGTGILLFFIPAGRNRNDYVLDWDSMRKMPWDILVLFGGGLSLAAAMEKTGLSGALAGVLAGMTHWPPLAMIFLVTGVMILATSLTSNTATATAFLPVVGALAVGVGQPAVLLCVPLALAASADFALPVGTPPNAIAYSSGLVSLPRMIRAGIWVNLLFALLLPLLMWIVGRWAFGL